MDWWFLQKGARKIPIGCYCLDSKTIFALNTEHMLPTKVWYRILSYLNNAHDLINLFVSKFTRSYVLRKFERSFFLSSGFCAFNFWIKKLNSNRVNLLSKLYSELDVFFDYDVWSRKLKQTMRHIMRQWDIYFNVKTMRYIMRQWDNETYYILVCMW